MVPVFASPPVLAMIGSVLALDAPPLLGEVRVDSIPPATNFEYVEIVAPAGSSLGDVAIVVIGDADDELGPALGNSGVVESAVPLANIVVPTGHCLLVHSGVGPVRPDFAAQLRLEDADNLTVLLVRGNSAVSGDDLDLDDDGILDFEPWKERLDEVAFVWSSPGVVSEHVYSDVRIGPLGGWFVFGARRCLDTGSWVVLPFAFNPDIDTPGSLNAPCQGVLCAGDWDTDTAVGSGDLSIMLANWGRVGAMGDLDGDGLVGPADLMRLLALWGPCDL